MRGLFQTIFGNNTGGAATVHTDSQSGFGILDGFLGAIRRTKSGVPLTPNKALTLSSYFACIRNISNDIAKMPCELKQKTTKGFEDARNNPLWRVLRWLPNPHMTAFDFWSAQILLALSWGNAYAEIVRSQSGAVVEMWPIHPSQVKVKTETNTQGTEILYYEVQGQGTETVRIEQQDMFHIHGPGWNGVTGFSVFGFHAESVGLGLAAQDYGATFFGNGAAPDIILTHPKSLDEKAQKNIRKSWLKRFRGATKAHGLAILEEDIKVTKLSVPPNEAQFLETRQFSVEEVARWFRMPPHLIGHLLRSTFNNIEVQSTEYLKFCLLDWIVSIEQRIQMQLIGDQTEVDEIGDLTARFNVHEFLRGDSKQRVDFYKGMFNMGSMSPHEIRIAEGFNQGTPEQQLYYMQSNMLPLNALGSGATKRGEETTDDPEETEEEEAEEENEEELIEDLIEDDNQMNSLAPVIEQAGKMLGNKEHKALNRILGKKLNESEMKSQVHQFLLGFNEDFQSAFQPIIESLIQLGMTKLQGVDAIDAALQYTNNRQELLFSYGDASQYTHLKSEDISESIQNTFISYIKEQLS